VTSNLPPESVPNRALDCLLTERETAALTSFSPRTLQGWRQRNEGPPYLRVGRSIRYRKSRILSWLASLDHLPDQPDKSVGAA
jgi:predicted DNA-binding transcriptional regulator AlpA